jgi:hypothetical protein
MLKSIEIESYRSCRSMKLDFARSVSALVGKNGVGKTNILQCVAWLENVARVPNIIALERPDNDERGFSVRATLDLDGTWFTYSLAAPAIRDQAVALSGQFVVHEKLIQGHGPHEQRELFVRTGQEINVTGKDAPIRVSPFAYSIGALMSLLPTDDPVRGLLDPVSSFFSGVTYYSLRERPEASDLIPEKAYDEWLRQLKESPSVTESVDLRLIYMMKQDPEMFSEFQALAGPAGLDLISRSEIVRYSSDAMVGQGAPTGPVQASYFYPAFEPAPHMAGAGRLFPFSQLSDGTRRAIRAITALLFDERSLILMEQPEDSIHPGLFENVIELLRSYSSRAQIIFTTHSPDVLDLLEPAEAVLVTAPDGHTAARRLSPDEIVSAQNYLRNEGSLSEYLELSNW